MECILIDSSGPFKPLEVCCLKPQFGFGILLEDIPAHLRRISLSSLADIYSLLKVALLKGRKSDAPVYQKVVEHFNIFNKYKKRRDSLL